MINLDYKDKRPLHQQISDGIKELVVNRVLCTDEKLPSVRELSVSLTVNPNTVQKAYKQLEADGFIYGVPGKGNFVSSLPKERDTKKIDRLYEEVTLTLKSLMYLGEEKEGIISLVDSIYSQKEEEQ